MLTTHIGKQVNIFWVFLSFAKFYLILVMQFFMDIQNFAKKILWFHAMF